MSTNKPEIKLKKPRAFSVSENRVTVNIEGSDFECANLLKSGLVNQTVILIAHENVWNEVNVLNLGADNSNLKDFKSHLELYEYKLHDFGIKTEKTAKIMQYGLCHEDYMKIEAEFPEFSYIYIGKLHKYLQEHNEHVYFDYLRDFVKMCRKRGITINEMIEELSTVKNKIINNEPLNFNNIINQKPILKMEKKTTDERIEQLIELGAVESENNYLIAGIEVTGEMITTLAESAWNEIIAGIEMIIPKSAIMQPLVDPDNETRTQYRTGNIKELGLMESGTDFVGFGFTVTLKSIEEDTDEEFNALVARIKESNEYKSAPVPVAPDAPATPTTETAAAPAHAAPLEAKPMTEAATEQTKKPIALETFGKLTPERISELQGLKEKQELIVKENPIVKITDKKTYAEAKKTAAVLLKASTAIDGNTGIEATATKFLNQFKTMIKNAVLPLAKITRDKYNEQKKIIDDWENAEAVRIQKEQQEKLKKIKYRTDKLFAVPMTFNGTLYTIGELVITPSEIETAKDADFEALVKQAEDIKKRIEDENKANEGKDAIIRQMAEQLSAATKEPVEQIIARMTGKPYIVPVEAAASPEPATPVAEAPIMEISAPEAPSTSEPAPAAPVATAPATPQQELAKWVAATVYTMPEPDNKLMNAMDLDNVAHLEKPAYIKCRSYYAKGLVDTAIEIERILSEGGKRAEVEAFLAIIKKSK